MTTPKCPRGSEWRRWDLQIHTPFSALNNGFGDDFDKYAISLLNLAIEKQIAVIGITDYFSIEGYKRLRSLLREPDRFEALVERGLLAEAQQIVLLPNIELRTSVVITRRDGTDSRVNFHVMFSEDLEPNIIEEHFLRELRFTAQADPANPDERLSLTPENLSELGRTLKRQHPPFQRYDDLYIGMLNAVVAHEDVTKVLERQPSRFKGRFLLLVPADEDLSECSWNGQGHLVRKLLIQKAHMLFSSNLGTREFGLGKRHNTIPDFVREFRSIKPCVHGSDAHSYDKLFEPAEGRQLWVKADPTFEGLQQLLHEPVDRVYIGAAPLSRSRSNENATKYMSALTFQRTEQAKPHEIWFSGELPLNHGLIAIIGNKGSGKSALADVLGLVGATRSAEHFSFLNKARFLHPKTTLGRMFRARVRWHSGADVMRCLSDSVDSTAPELVKYIPQNYLESICSELKESPGTRFDHELMEVIFSHVSDAQRLGKETLRALIDYVTNEKEERISLLLVELNNINKAIAALEDERTEEHRRSLESKLEHRRAELQAHDEAKPEEIPKPSEDLETQGAMELVRTELADLVEQTQQLDQQIAVAKEEQRTTARQVAAAEKLLTRIANLERQVEGFHADSKDEGETLGLDVRALVTLAVDRQPILAVRTDANRRSEALGTLLDTDATGSPAQIRREISAKTEATRSKLDEPNRRYQEYLRTLTKWKKGRAVVDGSATDPQSVKGLEAKLAALSGLPARIEERKRERSALVREVFDAKQQLLEEYRRLYSPVQQFIDTHPVSQQFQGALQFSASIAVDGLVNGLLEKIHQGKRGSFEGVEEGQQRLRDIATNSDFASEAGVEAFLDKLQDHLERDKRDGIDTPVRIRDQLRQGGSVEDIYDFVYGLDYLKPRFELRWQGKALDQLSPGERGNLLLVFYLLIDRRDVPLIIDQPEENLDNETIATMLVPAIKYAKEHRQIVIVTHNANLAVVCDADQVIHCQLDKTDGNRVAYTTGSIEDPTITQLIVDVLEGTKPAFDLRDSKYEILERPL